ncbi:hypothetical protein SAMN05216268_104203 [Streptomyces yunnanensis]|uniref:Uncharacterized protein n=1 Tax=Streptomyces yunnanensis TaxID=156453 RepID=A0A9X8QQP9_9ACTN|nr:hypothetical protein SAMN05216268_104203 [Streptomyces yunnanensis]
MSQRARTLSGTVLFALPASPLAGSTDWDIDWPLHQGTVVSVHGSTPWIDWS